MKRIAIAFAALMAAAALVPGAYAQAPYAAARHGGNYMYNYYLPPAPSSTPWAPAWAPDGKSLAVAMSGSIWKVDIATGAASEITYNAKYHSSPRYSPDGKWLVYTADDGGNTIQLEILNLATGKSHALTQDKAIYTDPVFSPDGSKLAYVSTQPSGYFNVYIRPIQNGAWAGPAVAVTRDRKHPSNRLYMGAFDMHIQPSWLASGQELLLVSNRDVSLGSGDVWRVPARENGMAEAKRVLDEQTLYRTQPDVSADGTRFVYASTRGAADAFNNIYIQPVAGGEPYKLTYNSHDSFHPRWSPDGEWIAMVSNAGGLPQLELLETFGGQVKKIAITSRAWKRPMGSLQVTVREGGAATPARILLTAADGKLYAPDTEYARVGEAGRDPLFLSGGPFTLELPVGPVKLLAMKGFEIWPQRVTANIRPGQQTRLTIDLKRMARMADGGWVNGTGHLHLNYAGNRRHTPKDGVAMAQAEDVAVAHGLVANKDNRMLDTHLFKPGAAPDPASTRDTALLISQEYRPAFWGHLSFLGLQSHILTPNASSYDDTAIASLYPSNTDMLTKARAQGAVTAYVHPYGGEKDPIDQNLGNAKGLIVDAALGLVDNMEWSDAGHAGLFPLYALWNNGLPVYATGGEDSISNLHRSKLIGSARAYVRTGAAGVDVKAWLDNLKKGHAFVTTGPLVELTVNGKIAGETVAAANAGDVLEISGHVRSITPLSRIALVRNGVVVEAFAAGGKTEFRFSRKLPAGQSGWYHLIAEGAPADRFPLDTQYALGFTNPVWVKVEGRAVRSAAAADYCLTWIDRLQKLVEASPDWRSEKEKRHVLAQLDQARAVYRKLKSES